MERFNLMMKAGVVFVSLFALSLIALKGDSQASAGRCWNAGGMVCCFTPEGVICH